MTVVHSIKGARVLAEDSIEKIMQMKYKYMFCSKPKTAQNI